MHRITTTGIPGRCHGSINATLEKRLDLAQSEQTPPEILADLINDENLEVRRWVVENPNFPSHLLDLLLVDGDTYSQQQIAAHRNASPDALDKLSRSPNWTVRIRVIYNPHTPPATLTYLAGQMDDYDGAVQGFLKNPNTPPLVKLWLQGGYGELSLKEFLGAACPTI